MASDYVWTFWSRPIAPRRAFFDLACLGLSVAFASRHGRARAVYTDSTGARWIETARIPVPVQVTLDPLRDENPAKFALAKIDTFARIDTPCTHIDYDVFLGRPQKKSTADFCCQSLEQYDGPFKGTYRDVHADFVRDAGFTPPEMAEAVAADDFCGYNMGYVQVGNLDFLHRYAAVSRPLFSHMRVLHRHNNIFPEQFLFYCMAKSAGLEVDVLFPGESRWDEPRRDQEFAAVHYAHFMGKKSRLKKFLAQEVLRQLDHEAPETHAALTANVDLSLFDPPPPRIQRHPHCEICERTILFPSGPWGIGPSEWHFHASLPQPRMHEVDCHLFWNP